MILNLCASALCHFGRALSEGSDISGGHVVLGLEVLGLVSREQCTANRV